jgi:hypothetical protein
MNGYSHVVISALAKEMEKMLVTYNALQFVQQADIPSNAIYYRFFLFLKLKFLHDHTFERMAARLCSMEQNDSSTIIDPATYAATGDHHLFLLAINSVIADAIKNGYLSLVELRRYDIPGGIYGAKPSNRIFDLDHSATLVAIGYSTYLADPRKFLWRCKDDPRLVAILNTPMLTMAPRSSLAAASGTRPSSS